MTDLWRGEWGDFYHARNPCTEAEIAKRILLWRKVFSVMSLEDAPKSFLDVGAGAGANAKAIDAIYKHNKIHCDIRALDVKPQEPGIIEGSASAIPLPDDIVDMVYTYGVLIHIPDVELAKSMSEIYRCSKRWIFCAEYFDPNILMVPYRGQSDALWKRPYGDLWLDNFDLKIVAYGYEWKRVSGLGDVTWWLMRKTSDKR